MIYFEQAQLEFFGKPIAYFPYFSAPDPTVKRKSGWLMPIFSSSSKTGIAGRGSVFLGAGSELRPDAAFRPSPPSRVR